MERGWRPASLASWPARPASLPLKNLTQPKKKNLSFFNHTPKALLNSSHIYETASKHAASYGVMVDGVTMDIPKMMAQKDGAVSGLTKGIEGLFKKNKVDYLKGWASFKSPTEVEVALADGGSTTVTAKNVIIATGSEVSPLPGLTIDEERVVSSTGALKLASIPKRMAVIGGGVIGLEMGSVWSRLGSEVTVIEFGAAICPFMDGDARKAFQRILQKQGLKFKTGTKVTGASLGAGAGPVTLALESAKGGDKKEELEADVVLVAAGRRPFTAGLNLEAAGITPDARGRIPTDGHFRTPAPGGTVFAIGDVIEGPMLAHKAEEDGIACVENLAGRNGHVNYGTVPSIIYTHPEVAWVGQTEEEVKAAGIPYKTGKFAFMANSRARTVDDADGMVKFVSHAETDKVLGAHIVGPAAGELIQEAVLAMEYGGTTEDIARTCHGHPTLSEAVKEAALATYDKAIHS